MNLSFNSDTGTIHADDKDLKLSEKFFTWITFLTGLTNLFWGDHWFVRLLFGGVAILASMCLGVVYLETRKREAARDTTA